MLFVEFRIPLYEGGVLRARKRKALIQLRETEQRLQAAERGALGELERAVLDLKASEPRIQAARRAVQLAEESLRVEREKFAQGRGTSNDLLLAEEALLRARTELAVALADSQIALAALKFATGEDPVSVAGGATSTGTGNN
jgi:outer membrane protein